jgi:hypothetical protein
MAQLDDYTDNPEGDNSRWQFSLLGMFWLTTVVAGVCAVVVAIFHHDLQHPSIWETLGGRRVLTYVVALWPLPATLVAWTCPGVSLARRLYIYAGIGAAAVLLFWCWHLFTSRSLFDATVDTTLVTGISMLVFWIPQFLIVVALIVCDRERRRRSQELQILDDVPAKPRAANPFSSPSS